MKTRVTSTQKKYLRLRERGQALLANAERVRVRAAKTCKHPSELCEIMTFVGVSIGDKCSFCELVRYIDGQWGPHAPMELIAKAKCKHPPAFLSDYTWEHDNGYGRQTQVVGERCCFCGSRKSWKTMGGWMTEEQYYRPRRDD